ncbi:hypothetical protein [Vulcanisaeta thermophila]|uniref:hypothetical protein n=1 Tax=Vulcanisaeta thermophila TaxID=867917 RepID=UPI001EE2C76E|nr:hypothetical protein [Vulcanisaeta thermophila]
MSVVRLRYAHSDPLFHYVSFNPLWAGNNESIKYILEGRAQVGFVPITHAARHCDVLRLVPKFAIYSNGPVISARLFKGAGRGYAAVTDTTVNAMALTALMNVRLEITNNVEERRRLGGTRECWLLGTKH